MKKKFNAIIDNYYANVVFEGQVPPPQGIPQDGGPVGAPAPGGQAPAPAAPPPPAPEAPKPLTSEGKKFLVELALKALAVDPSSISEQDKSIFETPVTTANADQIADRIKQIVEGL